jgi:hypothetical protein
VLQSLQIAALGIFWKSWEVILNIKNLAFSNVYYIVTSITKDRTAVL